MMPKRRETNNTLPSFGPIPGKDKFLDFLSSLPSMTRNPD